MYAFFLTKDQHNDIEQQYKKQVKIKQKELDEHKKKTKQIVKFRASYYITKQVDIIFYSKENIQLDNEWKGTDKQIQWKVYQESESKKYVQYPVDKTNELNNIIEQQDYKYLKIQVKDHYNHGLTYEAIGHPIVVKIVRDENDVETIELEHFDKYDLLVG